MPPLPAHLDPATGTDDNAVAPPGPLTTPPRTNLAGVSNRRPGWSDSVLQAVLASPTPSAAFMLRLQLVRAVISTVAHPCVLVAPNESPWPSQS